VANNIDELRDTWVQAKLDALRAEADELFASENLEEALSSDLNRLTGQAPTDANPLIAQTDPAHVASGDGLEIDGKHYSRDQIQDFLARYTGPLAPSIPGMNAEQIKAALAQADKEWKAEQAKRPVLGTQGWERVAPAE
jgi:hypothetical protein